MFRHPEVIDRQSQGQDIAADVMFLNSHFAQMHYCSLLKLTYVVMSVPNIVKIGKKNCLFRHIVEERTNTLGIV